MEEPDWDDMIHHAEHDAFEESSPPPPQQPKRRQVDEDDDHDEEEEYWMKRIIMADQEMEQPERSTAIRSSRSIVALSETETRTPTLTPTPTTNTAPSSFAAAFPNANHDRDMSDGSILPGGTHATNASVRESFERRHGKPPDSFTFDRYTKDSCWRATHKTTMPFSNDKNTLTALEWKPIPDSTTRTRTCTRSGRENKALDFPTAPDAQMLYYLARRYERVLFNRRYRYSSLSSTSSSRRTTQLLSRPIPGRRHYPLTLCDGTRVYVHSCCNGDSTNKSNNNNNNESIPNQCATKTTVSTAALGVSIKDLLRRVSNNQRKRQQAKNRPGDNPCCDAMTQSPSRTDHRLWVDKHAPTAFAHLLTDERTNRELVRALREWDPYVFHQDAPPAPPRSAYHNPPKEAAKVLWNKRDIRPDETCRVLLLSGPPGVGKSTLAHIVARHCGYRPLEINGSDERSASVLTDRVLRTMESNTITLLKGKEDKGGNNNDNNDASRPTCLILDEIDGADAGGAIPSLVEIIRAELPTKGMNHAKKKKSIGYLRRPMIFICNNKFVPALKPLLPYCRQFTVHPPAPARLVTRLRAVLAGEKISIAGGGSSLLHQLVSASGGDIRSCLYTLQFASAKANQMTLTLAQSKRTESLGSSSILDISQTLKTFLQIDGLKDARNDIASILHSVFKRTKQKIMSGGPSVARTNHKPSSDKVLELVQSTGEYSRILDCVFLNVPRISLIDPTFDRYSGALELLSSSDIFRSKATDAAQNNTSEIFSMQSKYMPCGAAAVHLICSVEQRPDLVYTTRELSENRFHREANQTLSHRFVESLSPQARALRCATLVAVETSPYVMLILSAGHGSSSLDRMASSFHLLSPREQMAFENHVATLRSLGLSYVASKELFGEPQSPNRLKDAPIVLDPPIDRFTTFPNFMGQTARKEIPDAMKCLLAQRAAQENIQPHKHEANSKSTINKPLEPLMESPAIQTKSQSPSTPGLEAEPTTTTTTTGSAPKRQRGEDWITLHPLPPKAKKAKSGHPGSNFLLAQAEKSKAAKTAQKRARAGVDRMSSKNLTSHTGSGIPMKHVFRLKYVKGFTQAVRVPCRYEDIV